MNTRRGFTLMELIVVIATMGIASTLCVVAMSRINSVWKMETSRTALSNNANTVFDACGADILAAQAGGTKFAAIAKAAPDADNKIPDDQLRISRASAGAPPTEILYQIDRKDGRNVLTRSEKAPGANAGPTQPVAEGVMGMSLEFSGKEPGSGWQRGWTRPETPGAVRVTLLLADGDMPDSQIVRKMVFPIVAN